MTKWLLGLTVAVASAGAAVAQYPGFPQAGGTSFTPPTQFGVARPGSGLSPYLNLALGRNLGVNYFNAVRPGLQLNQSLGAFGGLPGPTGFSQQRSGFLPAAANPTQEPVQLPVTGMPIKSLPPSSHPVQFGAGNRPVPGFGAPSRPGVFGNAPPDPFRRPAAGGVLPPPRSAGR